MKQKYRSVSGKIKELTHTQQQEEKGTLNNEDSSNNIKGNNILIRRVLEGEEREAEEKTYFKQIMAENFPNLGKERDVQLQEP